MVPKVLANSAHCSQSAARDSSKKGGCEANEASDEALKYLTVTVPEKGVGEVRAIHGVDEDLC